MQPSRPIVIIHTLLITILLLPAVARATESTPPAGVPTSPIPATVDVARALALIRAWEDDQPERAVRRLRVLYWTPADTEPNPGYRERLTRVMRYVRDFYAAQMAAYGLGARTVNLELAEDGLLRLRVVRGRNPFLLYRTESGQEVRKDCAAVLQAEGLNADDETMVIFCNLSQWDAEKRTMRQSSPYYAAGTHRNGTAWQVDSALLDSALLSDKLAMLSDGQYGRISVGRYNSIFVGGVAHELGHALGLPHCRESADELKTRGHALMGSGNQTMGEELRGEGLGSFLTLPHALKLATHVQFSGSVKRMYDKAEVAWSGFTVSATATGRIVISGTVSGKIPVYAVLGYADPAGGGDYDAHIGCGVPDATGHFSLEIPALSGSKATGGDLRLVACCVNGAATAYAGPDGKPSFAFGLVDGRVDLTATRAKIELDAALPKALAGQLAAAERELLLPLTRACLDRLTAPDSSAGKPDPVAVPPATRTIPLSDCRPLSAVTGWGGVHYDRLPPTEPLVCGGQLFVHGLYAHAAATHVYRLGKGWDRLGGQCGIGGSGYGPVEFVISGDGKELWRSGVVKPGSPQPFAVAVTGVEQIELKTLVTPAGPSGAWGVWLEPALERTAAGR
jgi:hypothetical protein